MARAWLMNGRGIARKVRNPTCISNYQSRELGIEAHRECPKCKNVIDNSDVSVEWPGLPAGVKFDPTDNELLEHLAGKLGLVKSHMFIDEFIPTLEGDEGICYTHPEKLPGVKQNGRSVHFFHRISNAYATGQRKRRKIHDESSSMSVERVRWHKTGKTKPVLENGVRKGWKKIMVLYKSLKKGRKPDKANWVMRQYHLGDDEDEKDGEMVVSKIFYQTNAKLADKGDAELVSEEPDVLTVGTGPTTPKTIVPELRLLEKLSPLSEELLEVDSLPIPAKDDLLADVGELESLMAAKDDQVTSLWLAGESQTVEEPGLNNVDESLFCHEVLDGFASAKESSMHLAISDFHHEREEEMDGNLDSDGIFTDLDNIPIDTPPDFHLADLQFGSQESISSWLDRL